MSDGANCIRSGATEATMEAAARLVRGELSVIEAARKLAGLRIAVVGDTLDDDWRVFAAIDSETDHLPIGAVRKHWAPDALAAKDVERKETEAFYRERALAAARNLMVRYRQNG